MASLSKIKVTFARVMFAPEILATTRQLADDFKEEIARIRIIARDAAITAGLWPRSKHGTWRFFLVTPYSMAGIDREGKRLVSGSDRQLDEWPGQPSGRGIPTILNTPAEILVHQGPKKARLYLFSLNPRISGVIIRKNAEPGRNNGGFSGGTG
jgi:hypothetical protein